MKVILVTKGAHPPYSEGYANYAVGLIRGLKTVEPSVKVYLLSTLRAVPSFNETQVSASDLIRYLQGFDYISPSWLFGNVMKKAKMLNRILSPIDETLFFSKALKTILRERSDRTVVHIIGFSGAFSFLKPLINKPIVYSFISRPETFLGLKADAVICTSSRSHEFLQKIKGNGCYWILPPVSLEIFRPMSKRFASADMNTKGNSFTLIFLGNIKSERFPVDFLKVIHRLAATVDTRLIIAAPNTLNNLRSAANIQREISCLGIGKNVKLLVKDLSDSEKATLLNAADCAVYPFSGTIFDVVEPPLSIMESLATGTPVIASDVASTGDIIDESVGALVRPFSLKCIDDWYSRLRVFAENTELIRKLSSNAVARARRFSEKEIASQILRIYSKFL